MAENLLTIPVEPRDIIFKLLFVPIVIRHGFGTTTSTNTSILRTCRQIYTVVKPVIAQSISLHFEGPAAMLDCLTTLSTEEIKMLRYIRVKAFPLSLCDGKIGYFPYLLSYTLPMFPGLQLGRLTVEDCYHDRGVRGDDADYATGCESLCSDT
jgi:hypothetical protein